MKKDRQTGHSRKNTANIGGAAYAPQQDEPHSKGDAEQTNWRGGLRQPKSDQKEDGEVLMENGEMRISSEAQSILCRSHKSDDGEQFFLGLGHYQSVPAGSSATAAASGMRLRKNSQLAR